MDLIRRYLELAIVGVVSAVFTNVLARKRFISERWWDRKADAYARILEALVQMQRIHDAYWEESAHVASLSDERKMELSAAWKAAWPQVDNAIRLGAFVISQEAHAALSKLQTATRDVDPANSFGIIDAELAATSVCIREVREIGRRDLQVDARWRRSFVARVSTILRLSKAAPPA